MIDKIYIVIIHLQAELVHLRSEVAELNAFKTTAETESHELLMKLHAAQLQLHSTAAAGTEDQFDSDSIRLRLVSTFGFHY